MHSAGFREFLLKPELLRSIQDAGFEHPSTVQSECIPQAMLGTDILCQATSGMGKTAVFVLSVLHRLSTSDPKIQAIVLAHTRELAYQISNEFDRFKTYLPEVRTLVVYGGAPYAKDVSAIANDKPLVVIGTPGRMKQLVEEKKMDLSGVKFFVVDECDQVMESASMRRDVQFVFRQTPHKKQTMMFTATLSAEMRAVVNKFLVDPLEVLINDGSKLTLHGLKQYYVELEDSAKTSKLVDLLDQLEFNQVVVFVSSFRRADHLDRILNELKFPCMHIHSAMPQPKRIERYKKFKEFGARIMVATDLFGRGIDIERVNVVFNYDMPESADQYLHRVGRAGRFGTKGIAISFVSGPEDAKVLNAVQERFVVSIPTLPDQVDRAEYT